MGRCPQAVVISLVLASASRTLRTQTYGSAVGYAVVDLAGRRRPASTAPRGTTKAETYWKPQPSGKLTVFYHVWTAEAKRDRAQSIVYEQLHGLEKLQTQNALAELRYLSVGAQIVLSPAWCESRVTVYLSTIR